MSIYALSAAARTALSLIERLDEIEDQARGVLEGDAARSHAGIDAELGELMQTVLDLDVDDAARYLRWLKERADALKRYADEVKAKAARAEARHKRVTEQLLDIMEASGRTKIRGTVHTIAVQAASTRRVEMVKGADVPDEFMRPPAAPQVDKRAVAKALKALPDGESLSFARLAPKTYFVRVR